MNIIHKTKPTKRTLDKALFNKRITVCNKAVSPDEANIQWAKVNCSECVMIRHKDTKRNNKNG